MTVSIEAINMQIEAIDMKIVQLLLKLNTAEDKAGALAQLGENGLVIKT